MSSKSDHSKGASGVAMSAGDASQDLQPVRFGSSDSEAQVRSLLSKVDTMRVRVRLADEQDVEGHLFGGGDTSLVLALQLSGDDDVEGHAISIHFPDAEQARRFRNELLAAGVLTATLAMGVGTGVALAPHQTGTAVPGPAPTVFMDTSAQAREGGAITQSSTLAIPVGSASDIAQKAQAAASSTVGTDTAIREGAVVNPTAAADAARTQAGITGSLAGSSTAATGAQTGAREGGALSQAVTPVNPVGSAAGEKARQDLANEIAAANTAGATGAQTGAREGGALSQSTVDPRAAADAARTEAGITGSLAGGSVNERAAADAARTAAGITGSLAGSSAAATGAQTGAREGGALSQSQATSSPKVDYSGKPLPPEPVNPADNASSQSGPSVDYSGKPIPTE